MQGGALSRRRAACAAAVARRARRARRSSGAPCTTTPRSFRAPLAGQPSCACNACRDFECMPVVSQCGCNHSIRQAREASLEAALERRRRSRASGGAGGALACIPANPAACANTHASCPLGRLDASETQSPDRRACGFAVVVNVARRIGWLACKDRGPFSIAALCAWPDAASCRLDAVRAPITAQPKDWHC